MTVSSAMIDFLKEYNLPWVYYEEASEKLIFVVDNTLLSTYRNCSQHFFYTHVEGYKRKSSGLGAKNGVDRIWFLEFGKWFHTMMEYYYRDFQKPEFDKLVWTVDQALAEWEKLDLNSFAEHPEFKRLNGFTGACIMLGQYWTVMNPLNERIRIIAREVGFGRAKEVPLYIGTDIEVYLSGRMDLIVDDGFFICPMDHKTEGTFNNDPSKKYEVDEGPTGYVYTLAQILPQLVPEGELLKRQCSKILINLIQKAPVADPAARFKRIAIRKTAEQLSEYCRRMTLTVKQLAMSLEFYAQSKQAVRNTTACLNWHRTTCSYYDLCRQNSADGFAATLSNGFTKLPIWNTEEVAKVE